MIEGRISRRKKRRIWRIAKDVVNYDPDPARCGNCCYRRNEVLGIPGKRLYSPHYCELGNFEIVLVGICNEWKDVNGNTLGEDEDGS